MSVWIQPDWLTVGARLKTRDGHIVTIVAVNPERHSSRKPVEGVLPDGRRREWELDGTCFAGWRDPFDLVAPIS